MRFAFDLNLPDERGDGLDGIGTAKSPIIGARVRQARMNALTDSPDLGLPGRAASVLIA